MADASAELNRLSRDLARSKQVLAEALPTEADCIDLIQAAWRRLQDLGWEDIMYSPKDGTSFRVIEFGSQGIHDCTYVGEWPEGGWFVQADGDLWPARPLCFRRKGWGRVAAPSSRRK